MSDVKWHWAELFVDGFYKAHKVVLASDYDALRADADYHFEQCRTLQARCGAIETERDALAQRCRELDIEASRLSGWLGACDRERLDAQQERDTLRAEVERLQAKLRRIESVAQCGSVQSWLALPDAAKSQWFAMHLEMEDERLADAARLQWLADNMRLMSGHKDTGHYQLPELVEWVESVREGCTIDDLRAALDAMPEAI